MALTYAANIPNYLIVPYAACLLIELYKSDDNELLVEIYYRNDTTKDPFPQTVPGCKSFSCPLADLEQALQPNILYSSDQRNNICGRVSTCVKSNAGINSSILGVCLGMTKFVILTLYCFTFYLFSSCMDV